MKGLTSSNARSGGGPSGSSLVVSNFYSLAYAPDHGTYGADSRQVNEHPARAPDLSA